MRQLWIHTSSTYPANLFTEWMELGFCRLCDAGSQPDFRQHLCASCGHSSKDDFDLRVARLVEQPKPWYGLKFWAPSVYLTEIHEASPHEERSNS